MTCLLVDDSEEYLAAAARLLNAQGVEVVGTATSYDDALRIAEELVADIALIDVELGTEDGVALARELNDRVPTTKTVLISAHELEDLELSDLDPDAVFLPKADVGAKAIGGLLDY